MADVLVDSDGFIDHLRGARSLPGGLHRLHYSVITRCELFSGRAAEEGRVNQLLEPLIETSISRAVAEAAGRLRREFGLRTPDALIAATALENRLVLWTRNVRDFARVRNLDIRQPGD
jgi:predicted nucleic acid-binding protein